MRASVCSTIVEYLAASSTYAGRAAVAAKLLSNRSPGKEGSKDGSALCSGSRALRAIFALIHRSTWKVESRKLDLVSRSTPFGSGGAIRSARVRVVCTDSRCADHVTRLHLPVVARSGGILPIASAPARHEGRALPLRSSFVARPWAKRAGAMGFVG